MRAPSRFSAPPTRFSAAPKKAEPFYLSRAWLGLVARLKVERGGCCVRCGAGGRGVRIIGDHIVERRHGGADLDPANIQLLCLACHNVKTADAKAARVGLRAPPRGV